VPLTMVSWCVELRLSDTSWSPPEGLDNQGVDPEPAGVMLAGSAFR
jgi:hypothetical protein